MAMLGFCNREEVDGASTDCTWEDSDKSACIRNQDG